MVVMAGDTAMRICATSRQCGLFARVNGLFAKICATVGRSVGILALCAGSVRGRVAPCVASVGMCKLCTHMKEALHVSCARTHGI